MLAFMKKELKLLPDGYCIYKKYEKAKGIDATTAILSTRQDLVAFYGSPAADKVSMSEAFKKCDMLNFSVRQDNSDKKSIFVALVVGVFLVKTVEIFSGLLTNTAEMQSAAAGQSLLSRVLLALVGLALLLGLLMLVAVPISIWLVMKLEQFNRNNYINYILPLEVQLIENLLRTRHHFDAAPILHARRRRKKSVYVLNGGCRYEN